LDAVLSSSQVALARLNCPARMSVLINSRLCGERALACLLIELKTETPSSIRFCSIKKLTTASDNSASFPAKALNVSRLPAEDRQIVSTAEGKRPAFDLAATRNGSIDSPSFPRRARRLANSQFNST